MIQGFSHYNLRAPRELLDALRDFYCDVVGLTVGERPPFRSFGYWLYAGGEALLHLSECSPDEHRAVNVSGTFDHAAFACTGLAEFVAHLGKCGVQYEMARVPQTKQVQLFLTDPAGNGVELNFASEDA
jgi:catechol-2,3-dioxygenase